MTRQPPSPRIFTSDGLRFRLDTAAASVKPLREAMRKVALVFVVAVLAPSLVLAWLAVRSLRDQQLIVERQRYLLCQGVADKLADMAGNFLNDQQAAFRNQVEALLAQQN